METKKKKKRDGTLQNKQMYSLTESSHNVSVMSLYYVRTETNRK